MRGLSGGLAAVLLGAGLGIGWAGARIPAWGCEPPRPPAAAGDAEPGPGPGPCLPGPDEVLLDGYAIDRYEYPNVPGALPLVEVTWPQAQARCRERGQRLCTEREWEQACGGSGNLAFGYGPSFEPGRCNTPVLTGGGWQRGPGLAGSGSYPGCASEAGVYDLIGNAWEWVDGWYDRESGWRVVRGGSWFTSANLARTHARYGRFLTETYRLDLVGFRCCRSAPPRPATPAQAE